MRFGFLIALIAFLVVLALGSGGLIGDKLDGDGGLVLRQPSLMALAATTEQERKGVNFLQQEAGIAAYVKVDQKINLEQVRDAFKTIETVSDEYIIGEVALPKLPEKAHPHVYVNKDGWIVAYYSKDEPASKIMQWVGYKGGKITTTTLEDAIHKIWDASRAPLPFPQEPVKYYDFEYPNANRIMLIAEINDEDDSTDSFFLKIPRGLRLHEASWTLYHSGGWGDIRGSLKVNDKEINSIGAGFRYGALSTTQLTVEFRHKVKVWNWRGFTGAAVVLIYQAGG